MVCYWVPNQSNLNTNDDETYKKIAIVVKEVRVGESHLARSRNTGIWKESKPLNSKRIYWTRLSQCYKLIMPWLTNVNCKKETMGALWKRGSVNLFICVIYHKSEAKIIMFCTKYKGKDKFSTGLFLNMLYNDYISSNEHVTTKVIWSNGPSSEFKNKYMCFLIQELSKKYGKPFIWKFSATSHGKGIVDGVGGKVKLSVHKKVMSLGKDRPTVQDSESFANLANEQSESTSIIHMTNEEVSAYKDSNPFEIRWYKFVPLVQLFIPQGRYQCKHPTPSPSKTSIKWSGTRPRSSFNVIYQKEVQTEETLVLPWCCKNSHGEFLRYYAVITELSKLNDDDEVEINYLNKSFEKWAAVNNDLDSRMICQLTYIDSTIDGRSRYTIKE